MLRRKHSVFGVHAQNDVILVHSPYPASQGFRHVDANASTLRILLSIGTAEKFRTYEIQGIGRRLMKHFGVPAVLQKHILSHWFCHWRKAAVVTKHFLSALVNVESVSGERGQYGATGA